MDKKKIFKLSKIITVSLFIMVAIISFVCILSDNRKSQHLIERENSVYSSSINKIDYKYSLVIIGYRCTICMFL